MGRTKEPQQSGQARYRFRDRSVDRRSPLCVTFVERTEDDEERWHGIGSIEGLILLVVVRTYRQVGDDQIIRMISARQATRHERKLYEATHR